MRVYGIGRDIMTAFGGTPVSMPMPEAYEAIRTGVVSGIMVPFSEMRGYRLIDVCFHHIQSLGGSLQGWRFRRFL